ncbi:MAG: hypothetical protein KC468_19800 [Myxococcales bacterium]|nr:hypothetical protein [Myxococcales bacterium]
MKAKGFHEWKPGLWVRFKLVRGKTGKRMIGAAVWKIGDQVLYAGASVAYGPCLLKAATQELTNFKLANLIENLVYLGTDTIPRINVVSGLVDWKKVGSRWKERFSKFRKRAKDGWKKFKTKVHKSAEKIAKNRVMTKIRAGFARVLESPVGDILANVGSKFLNVWGVPAPVAKFAINQRRFAQIDRLRHGGWSGLVARTTAKGAKAKAIALEIAKRNGRAAAKAAIASLGGLLGMGRAVGGKLLGKLGKNAGGKLLSRLVKGKGGKVLAKLAGKSGLKVLSKLGGNASPKLAKLLGGKLGSTAVKSLVKRPEGRKIVTILAQRAASNISQLARKRIADRQKSALVDRARPSKRGRPLGPVVVPPQPRPRPQPSAKARQRSPALQSAMSEYLRTVATSRAQSIFSDFLT